MAHRPAKHSDLAEIKKEISALQKRVSKIQKDGFNVDQINAALSQLNTDVDALIAKGAGAITPAQAATIAQALTDMDTKIKSALTT